MARREALIGYIFLLPWLLGLLFFLIGPAIGEAVLSFAQWSGSNNWQWVGFGNYVTLVHDTLFWTSLRVTVTYVVLAVPGTLVIALLAALLLNRHLRFIGLFRTLYYLPVITPAVASAIMWSFVFNKDFGLLNYFLSLVGISPIDWLNSIFWVLPALIFMAWWGFGSSMIIFLGGLQGIPQEIIEAATIDGATTNQRFWRITLPMLSPTILFNLVTGFIAAFQVFTPAYILTQGGPNYASYFYALYMYQSAFEYANFGYAAAMSVVMFILTLIVMLFIFKGSQARVYYAAGDATL
ncbi:MAG: sugar ABC transporter permease [Chloroflexi bacterium]|nr:sugar ABC transporter permease [Chloroflexota bacterium]